MHPYVAWGLALAGCAAFWAGVAYVTYRLVVGR